MLRLSGGRIVEATIKAVVETTEGVRLQVSFGEETALIYPWQIVEDIRRPGSDANRSLQPGRGTKGLRIYPSIAGRPIDGHAICQAVDTNTLMRLRCHILRFSPEPQDRTIIAFLYSTFAFVRCGLKYLKPFHRNFRMCLLPTRSRYVRHSQRTK